jgi:hypothetical protein
MTSKKRKAVDAADQVNQQMEEKKKEEQKKTKETVWCWVKIYLGPNDRNPTTLGVADFVGNVYQIKKAVKKECPLALAHCDTAFLQVYAPGTPVPPPPMELDETVVVALDADQAIDPHGTSATTKRGGRGPIIVIVPMP